MFILDNIKVYYSADLYLLIYAMKICVVLKCSLRKYLYETSVEISIFKFGVNKLLKLENTCFLDTQ